MTLIQLRRGIAEGWGITNPTLAEGEVGLELDTGKFKWGDGATAWNDLDYVGSSGPAFAPQERAPRNPANATWSLTVTGGPDGGTFTLLIDVDNAGAVETDPIDWNETNTDLRTLIGDALGGEWVTVDGGPLPDDVFSIVFQGDLDNTPVDVQLGDNSLTGGSSPTVTLFQITEGGTGDIGFPEGTGWWNDDDSEAWVNNGDEETPDWRRIGLPSWFQHGEGTPVNNVTPASEGSLYFDTSNGALYVSFGTDPATSWKSLGGDTDDTTEGVRFRSNGQLELVCHDSERVIITDVLALLGSGNGVYWGNTTVDGEQTLTLRLGNFDLPLSVGADLALDVSGGGGIKFPTADPLVAGAWWDDAGTLTKSAG